MSINASRRRGRIGATIALALSVAACGADTTFWTPAAAPKANKVELVHLTYDVAFAPSRVELDRTTQAGLDAFLARHDVGFGDRIYVVTGAGAANPVARRRADGISAHLAHQGLAPKLLQNAEWTGVPEVPQTVRVLIHRFVVRTPNCPDFRKPTQSDHGNTESSNFGCATATNLGLMVADPRDLIEGRDEGMADGEREAAAIKRYREGKEKELDKSGSSAK